MILRLLIAVGCWCCLVATIDAQSRATQSGRIEVAGGAGLFGGTGLGERDANLRANSVTPAPYRLFTTTSSFGAAPLVEARVAVGVSRRLAVEGRFGFSRPEIRTSISSDAEQGSPVTAVEQLDQYMIDGSIVLRFDRFQWSSVVPFAAAGAGYVRQLHEGQTLVEDGHSYHVGGGVRRRLFLNDRGFVKSAGVRGDVRVYLLSGGAAFDTATRAHVAVSAAFFAGF